ncbi:MAG: hypothetical protein M3Q07_27200 [Pseudobdellovibrionaceae bacterium]|nr:hypothetical protein [Pseudobdellovibrionaceae bacterium]
MMKKIYCTLFLSSFCLTGMVQAMTTPNGWEEIDDWDFGSVYLKVQDVPNETSVWERKIQLIIYNPDVTGQGWQSSYNCIAIHAWDNGTPTELELFENLGPGEWSLTASHPRLDQDITITRSDCGTLGINHRYLIGLLGNHNTWLW